MGNQESSLYVNEISLDECNKKLEAKTAEINKFETDRKGLIAATSIGWICCCSFCCAVILLVIFIGLNT